MLELHGFFVIVTAVPVHGQPWRRIGQAAKSNRLDSASTRATGGTVSRQSTVLWQEGKARTRFVSSSLFVREVIIHGELPFIAPW